MNNIGIAGQCPRCGGTLKHKVKLIVDKRRKTPKDQYDLVCARCGYVKPKRVIG